MRRRLRLLRRLVRRLLVRRPSQLLAHDLCLLSETRLAKSSFFMVIRVALAQLLAMAGRAQGLGDGLLRVPLDVAVVEVHAHPAVLAVLCHAARVP